MSDQTLHALQDTQIPQRTYLSLAALRLMTGEDVSDGEASKGGSFQDPFAPPSNPPRRGIPLEELRDMYRGVWQIHVVSVNKAMPCRNAYEVAAKDIPAATIKGVRDDRYDRDRARVEAQLGADRQRLLATVAVHLLHPNFDHGHVLNLAVVWLTATLLSTPDLTLDKLDAWVHDGPAREGNNPTGRIERDAYKSAPGAVRVRTLLRAMAAQGVWPQLALDMVAEALRVGLIERVCPSGDPEVFHGADWICLGRGGIHRVLEVCVCGLAPGRTREPFLGVDVLDLHAGPGRTRPRP